MSALVLPPGALPEGEAIQSEHHLRLDPIPRQVSAARRFVSEHAPSLDSATHDNIVLLTSELVTNVVIHARTVLIVGVVVTPNVVIVTVHDLDLGHTEIEPLQREGGRGLMLVKALSDATGLHQEPGSGKTAWFRLRRDAAPETDTVDVDALLDKFDL